MTRRHQPPRPRTPWREQTTTPAVVGRGQADTLAAMIRRLDPDGASDTGQRLLAALTSDQPGRFVAVRPN